MLDREARSKRGVPFLCSLEVNVLINSRAARLCRMTIEAKLKFGQVSEANFGRVYECRV